MRTLFVSGFLVIGSVLFACQLKPAVRSNEGTLEPKSESVEEAVPSEQAVDFEGVSFRYDPSVFGDVTKEVVAEHRLEEPDHKPDRVAPQHVRFQFELGETHSEAELLVFAIDDFPGAYSVSPEMVEYASKDIEALRKVVKNPTYRRDGEIPHLLFEDVSYNFYAKVRELNFQNGDGVIFVTRWSHGADLISNRNLVYRFEGITSDGRYYVTAETPVSVAFLSDDDPEEFEGYTYENLYGSNSNSKETMSRIEGYRKSITTRLEKLNSNDYSPALEKFEAMISSLRVNGSQNRER